MSSAHQPATGMGSFPSTEASSLTVICPLSNHNGPDNQPTPCGKKCTGDKRFRSLQEHIRRAHALHYIPKLPATAKSIELMVNKHISAEDLANFASSQTSTVPPQQQQQQAPRSQPSYVQPRTHIAAIETPLDTSPRSVPPATFPVDPNMQLPTITSTPNNNAAHAFARAASALVEMSAPPSRPSSRGAPSHLDPPHDIYPHRLPPISHLTSPLQYNRSPTSPHHSRFSPPPLRTTANRFRATAAESMRRVASDDSRVAKHRHANHTHRHPHDISRSRANNHRGWDVLCNVASIVASAPHSPVEGPALMERTYSDFLPSQGYHPLPSPHILTPPSTSDTHHAQPVSSPAFNSPKKVMVGCVGCRRGTPLSAAYACNNCISSVCEDCATRFHRNPCPHCNVHNVSFRAVNFTVLP